jgi:hypothetical protein
MAKIIDFKSYKEQKVDSEKMESLYLDFLKQIHVNCGVPKSIADCFQCLYNALRYFEGSLNCLHIIKTVDTRDISQIKSLLIDWLEEIIDNIKKY